MDLGEIHKLIDTTLEELAEDNVMETSVFKPVPENKMTSDNLAGGSDYTRLLLTSVI